MIKTDNREVVTRLEKLGFKGMATKIKKLESLKRKLALAYEHYRFVRPEKIHAFNMKLRQETGKNMHDPLDMEYQTLAFTPVQDYEACPPEDVLMAMEVAQEKKCFDSFEVAYIKNVKDPILFGRIETCSDRFYIAQWDDDVKIEDILMANEG